MNNQEISSIIKHIAKKRGFDLVGFTKPFISKYTTALQKFIQQKKYHQMDWFCKNNEQRADISNAFSNLKSIISLGICYNITKNIETIDDLKFSKYCMVNDYHTVMRKNADILMRDLSKILRKSIRYRIFTDSCPILEKEVGEEAGIGFFGKNTVLINPDLGSFFFLTEILTDLDISFRPYKINTICGSCSLCIDSCPTQALGTYSMEPARCISYLTVEFKGIIDDHIKPSINNHVYGCDICQAVCPYNTLQTSTLSRQFNLNKNLLGSDTIKLLGLNKKEFSNLFKDYPVIRTGLNRFLRNLLIVCGNLGKKSLLPHIEKYSNSNSIIIKDAAIYALNKM